jgi:outer membrane protein assembly factor BamE (lipoprotein component of BamABCDE complex)
MRLFHRVRAGHAALVVAACCLLVAGCTGGPTGGSGKDSQPENKSVKEKFDKVKTDMSEKEVADIMGAPASSAELDPSKAKDMLPKGFDMPDFPALPGIAMSKLTVKNWEEGDTVFTAVFKDGKVVSTGSGKKEAGKQASKVTKANMEKIKLGMKKPEVEDILGKGETKAGAKIEGFTGADIIVWTGDEGTITIGFADDKVAAPAVWVSKGK